MNVKHVAIPHGLHQPLQPGQGKKGMQQSVALQSLTGFTSLSNIAKLGKELPDELLQSLTGFTSLSNVISHDL